MYYVQCVVLSLVLGACLARSQPLHSPALPQNSPSDSPTDFQFHVETISRHNYGTIFRRQPRVLLNGYSDFKVHFQIPRITLPDFPKPTQQVSTCSDQEVIKDDSATLVCQSLAVLQGSFLHMYQSLVNEAKYQNNAIRALLTNPITPTVAKRLTKRAPLGIIGSWSRSLFGTASLSDVRRVYAHVQQLESYVQSHNLDLSSLEQKLTTFFNLTSSRISGHETLISNNFNTLKNVVQSLSDTQVHVHDIDSDLIQLSLRISQTFNITMDFLGNYLANIQALQIFLTEQQKFLNGIEQLLNGRLTHTMVHPRQLQQALSKVRRSLKTSQPTFQLLHNEMSWYYNHHLTMFVYTETNLFIFLSLPIANQISQFDFYSITTFPIPFQTNNNTDPGYTIINTEISTFAIDPSRQVFIELNSKQLESCSSNRLVQCPTPFFRYQRPSLTCIAALFLDKSDKIISLCEFTVYAHQHPAPQIFPIGPSEYLLTTSVSPFQTICDGTELQTYSQCRFCYIRIPCNCILLMDDRQFSPNLYDCDTDLTVTMTLHTVNLALLRHFDLPANIFSSSSLTNKSITLSIPNITKSIETFSDLTQKDHHIGFDLAKLVNAMANEHPALYTPPSSEDTTLISLPWDDTESSRLIWLIVCSASIALNVFITLFLLYKFNRIIGIVSALQTTRANPIPHILITHSSVSTTTSPPLTVTTSGFSYFNSFLALFIILIVIYSLVKLRSCRFSIGLCCPAIFASYHSLCGLPQYVHNLRLVLQLHHKGCRCILYLASLPHAPNLLSYTVSPLLTSITVARKGCSTYLCLTWAGPLQIFVNGVSREFHLPTELPVPYFLQSNILAMIDNDDDTDEDNRPMSALFFQIGKDDQLYEIPAHCINMLQPPIHVLQPSHISDHSLPFTALRYPYREANKLLAAMQSPPAPSHASESVPLLTSQHLST